MEIPRLNIRQTMTRIGTHSKLATVSTRVLPTERQGDYQAPRSGVGFTQAKVDINSYPSRRAYGYTNHGDFAREKGSEGLSDLSGATSRHTSEAWSIIDNAAKPGSRILIDQAKSRANAFISEYKSGAVVAKAIPPPQMSAQPSRIVGENDPGHYTLDIKTQPKADVQVTPGSFDIYVEQKGDIQRWVTMGKYDVYA